MTQHHPTLFVLLLVLPFALLLTACGGGGGGDEDPFDGLQTLFSVLPISGPTAGGTEVTITGSGFLNPSGRIIGILFDDEPVLDWEIVNDTTIVLTTPPGDPGAATIWIIGSASTREDGAILTGGFQYVAPTVLVADGPAAVNPQLYRVDVGTGSIRLIGPTGFGVVAMAMGPDDMLYAVEGASPYRLIRIDPASGVAQATQLVRDAQTQAEVPVDGLTFLGGLLYGRTQAQGLVRIDLATGFTTPISALAGAQPGTGIAALGGEVLLAPTASPSALQVWTPATDAVSVGPVLAPPNVFEALAVGGGMIYGLDAAPPLPGTRRLFEIDPGNGAVRVAATLPDVIEAVARDR